MALLIAGAELPVRGASSLASAMGVSPLVIDLAVVAFGTGAPELAISLKSATAGQGALAVGNVVGSNLFNLTAVLGLTGLLVPGGLELEPFVLRFDLPLLIAVAFTCLPIFFTGGRIARREGALLLGYQVACTTYLVLAATEHVARSAFATSMLYFLLPLTALTLLVTSTQQLRSRPDAERL